MKDNEVSSYSDLDNEERENFALKVSHQSNDEENEGSDFETNNKPSYDELQNAFLDFHVVCLTLTRQCTKQK